MNSTLQNHSLFPELRQLALPLVPELKLLLLPSDSPTWARSDPESLGWPYWAFAWPGGQALARYVLDHPQLVAQRKVVSFGAGGAIEAIAAARCGATVLCTDIDPLACEAAYVNARLNGTQLTVSKADILGQNVDADVLLIGDVCYEDELAERVLAWAEAQAARGVQVLVGDPGRVQALPSRGYQVIARLKAPFDGDPEGSVLWDTLVYQVHTRD